MTKIAPNIVKVGVHSYLLNAKINLQSNFNSEKLAKIQTSSCALTKVSLKGSENSSERCESWCALLFIERGT